MQTKKRNMKIGDAFVGIKRSGSQLCIMLGAVPANGKRGREHRTSADRTSCKRRLLKGLQLHAVLYGYASIQSLLRAGGNYRAMVVGRRQGWMSCLHLDQARVTATPLKMRRSGILRCLLVAVV